MAITEAEVHAVIDRLVGDKDPALKLSSHVIRKELGGRGSLGTIVRHRSSRASRLDSSPTIEEIVKMEVTRALADPSFVTRVASIAIAVTKPAIDAVDERMIEAAEASAVALETVTSKVDEGYAAATKTAEALSAAASKSALEALEMRVVQLESALSKVTGSLNDADLQIEILKNARSAASEAARRGDIAIHLANRRS